MDDNVSILALNMASTPGAYALLLGSGISTQAGIPTGHELILSLIRRLAAVRGEQCEPDPEAWFRDAAGIDPEYSAVLEHLARTPEERRALLARYFEATEEEAARGEKAPTLAHQSIADLVAKGFITTIITTNFDHLLERAIRGTGVTPVVLSTPGQIRARRPLQFNACTIIKIHGDYLDASIRNTDAELGSYDEDTNALLDRVFDEHGLIICGWSSTWDQALRDALDRCPTHRFTTYWTRRSEPSELELALMERRRAQTIKIDSADDFFQHMEGAVIAASSGGRPGVTQSGPTSVQSAVNRLEADLDDPSRRIQVQSLLREQVSSLADATGPEAFPTEGKDRPTDDSVRERILTYDSLSEACVALMASGCYWAREEQSDGLVEMLATAANVPEPAGGFTVWIHLHRYPALLMNYAGGIAAVAAGRYTTLLRLTEVSVATRSDGHSPAALALQPREVVQADLGAIMPGVPDRAFTPTSEYLFARLGEPLKKLLRPQSEYERNFDRFEYVMALVQADLSDGRAYHIGRFGWKAHNAGAHEDMLTITTAEIEAQGPDWAPLRAGMFGGDLDRLQAAKIVVDESVRKLSWW